MLENTRYATTLGGQPVTLTVRHIPAVQSLRLLNKLSGILAGGLAGLTGGKFAWCSDDDFEHVQRVLLASVTIHDAVGTAEVLDFEAFIARVDGDVEVVLELLWQVLVDTYPRSFSKARGLLSNPTSLANLLEKVIGKYRPAPRPVAAPAASAPNASRNPAPNTATRPMSKASAY